jgi:hypothetical protein
VNRIAAPFGLHEGPFSLNSRPRTQSTATKTRLNGPFAALRNPLALYSLQAPRCAEPGGQSSDTTTRVGSWGDLVDDRSIGREQAAGGRGPNLCIGRLDGMEGSQDAIDLSDAVRRQNPGAGSQRSAVGIEQLPADRDRKVDIAQQPEIGAVVRVLGQERAPSRGRPRTPSRPAAGPAVRRPWFRRPRCPRCASRSAGRRCPTALRHRRRSSRLRRRRPR